MKVYTDIIINEVEELVQEMLKQETILGIVDVLDDLEMFGSNEITYWFDFEGHVGKTELIDIYYKDDKYACVKLDVKRGESTVEYFN